MEIKVKLSRRAEREFDKIVEYLELKWSEQSVRKFRKEFEIAIERIKRNPDSYQKTIPEGISLIRVNKKTTLLYRKSSSEIRILSVFSNRRDPGTKPE
ncbi:MAG: type II toxin-antitoxin system RelE/ParE family toxin [Bacteroidia bacterium]|nr:type II toxin-antitoxin system RelE/ParE family toxin [Bacteroidia bacterium]